MARRLIRSSWFAALDRTISARRRRRAVHSKELSPLAQPTREFTRRGLHRFHVLSWIIEPRQLDRRPDLAFADERAVILLVRLVADAGQGRKGVLQYVTVDVQHL